MTVSKIHAGMTVGRWLVVERAVGTPLRFLCRCSCGTERLVKSCHLAAQQSKSCGCLGREKSSALATKRNLKHGHARRGAFSSEYQSWTSMLNRCKHPYVHGYQYYGGRGISVCQRWVESFENFLADMGPKPSSEHTIERIDNNGNYEPANCRWATRLEQTRNRRIEQKKAA